jgi:hypothetical protein
MLQTRSTFTFEERRLSGRRFRILDRLGDDQFLHHGVSLACVNLKLDGFRVFIGRDAFCVSSLLRPGRIPRVDDGVVHGYFSAFSSLVTSGVEGMLLM